ncbi:hypothetical protein Tco_0484523 [Tanacetum coccineum]
MMSKLLEDVRNIREELSEYINCLSWNHPTFYDNDDDEYTIIYSKPKAITLDLPIEEPDNSLSMGEGTISISEDSSTFDALSDHSEILSDSNNDGTASDDNDFKDIEYVDASPPDSELVSLEEANDIDQEEKEFDLEDILHQALFFVRNYGHNIRLISYIQIFERHPSLICVESPSSVPIPVTDSNSFFEKSDTSFSFSDKYFPEFMILAIYGRDEIVG